MKPEIKSKLKELITDAMDYENTGHRVDLFDRYMGEPYGDEIEGRSKFIDTSSQDAVEAVLPDLMEVFTGSKSIVEFSPVGPADEEAAEQETEVVHDVFWEQNKGYENLYVWFKEALITQNSYVQAGWVEREEVQVDEYEDLTPEEFTAILQELEGQDYEFLEQSGFEIVEDEETGAEIAVPEITEEGIAPIDIKVRCVKKLKEYEITPFPNEDFFGTPRWGSVCLQGIPCAGRIHRGKSREDLIEMGFSETSIDEVAHQDIDDEERDSRHHTQDLDESESENDLYEVAEVYVKLDIDDDGKAELIKAWVSTDGSNIMKWENGQEAYEEVSSVPFYALTPYIIPHRHIGRSIVELVDDIQRVKTVVMRHILDNMYATNYRRPHFNENLAGENTYEDLMNPDHGTPVRQGEAEVRYDDPPFMAAGLLPLIEKFDGLQEQRTGATRYNQGLDAESLNKTMGGIAQIRADGMKKIKLIARTLAETGIRDLMLGIHRDLRAGPIKEMVLKLRGRWVSVDPRHWRQRNRMKINVGMGRGDMDMRRQGLSLVIQGQEKLLSAGSRLVTEQTMFNAIEDLAETYGVYHVEKYIQNPATLPPPPPPPPPPDPIMISAQAQAQKVMVDGQIKMQEMQLEYEQKMKELEIKEADAANRIQTDDEKMDIERKKLELEAMKADIDARRLQSENHHKNEDRRSKNNEGLVSAGLPPDYSFDDDRAQFKAIMEKIQSSDEAMAQMIKLVADGQVQLGEGQKDIADGLREMAKAGNTDKVTEITLSDGRKVKGVQKSQ